MKEATEADKKKKWQKCRRFVMVHLLKAISAGVQKDMEVLGWDIKNPYNTIEMAKRAVTQVSGDSLRQLLDSWNRLNARGYRNLKDFIQHVQQLRDTLKQHGHNIEDNTAILNVLTAIESVDPAWVHLLEHDYTCGNLPWSKFTSLCMAKGNIQLTRSAFASIVDSDDSSLPQAKYDAQIKYEGCGREGYAKKDCWNCIRGPPRGGYRGRGRGMSRGRGAGRGRGGQRPDESKPSEMDATSSIPRSILTQPPPPSSFQPQQPQQPQQSQQARPQQQDSADKPKATVSEGLLGWRTGNMAVRNQIDERNTWMVDSGCSGHITNDMKWYIDYVEFSMPRIIKGLAPETTLAWGTGTVLLPALRPEGRSELELQDVWFAPTAPCNMLSPNRLEELGAIHDPYTSSLTQVEPRVILASIVPWNGVKAVQLNMEAVSKLKETDETRLAFFSMHCKVLHRRLMHAGVERTLKAADQAGIRLSN